VKPIQSILVGGAILALAACSNASIPGSGISSTQAEVVARFENLASAVKTGDQAAYLKHFNEEDFTALNANGKVTHDFDASRLTYTASAASIAKHHSLEFENVKVTVLEPTVALLLNEYSAEIELISGDIVTVSGAGEQVWHKSNKEWVLNHVSSSTKP